MHTNAGVVTALQQAVAHLSSALETLTNADINMLMSTCCNMDAWRTHIWTTCLLRYRCSVQPRKHRRLFFLFFLAIVSARLSTWLQQSELSKFILTRPCLMKQVNNLWWTGVNTFPTAGCIQRSLSASSEMFENTECVIWRPNDEGGVSVQHAAVIFMYAVQGWI